MGEIDDEVFLVSASDSPQRIWSGDDLLVGDDLHGTQAVYGTTNADAGVGIGMKRGDSKI